MDRKTARKIAQEIIGILEGRKGFSWWWDDAGEDNQREIWTEMTDAILEVANKKKA